MGWEWLLAASTDPTDDEDQQGDDRQDHQDEDHQVLGGTSAGTLGSVTGGT